MNNPDNATAATIQPYLFFEGKCEEALEFYKRTIGAEILGLMRFKDSPEPPPPGSPPVPGDKGLHATFRVGNTTIMASDGQCAGKSAFQGFALSLNVTTPAEAERAFGALGAGGEVRMPLMKTFFSPRFGMVADRYGITWMIYMAPDQKSSAECK